MSALNINVVEWLGEPSSPEEFTLGALRIGIDGHRPFTEVHDAIALTTRDLIRVPAYRVAEWLVTHWWRLRWEPVPDATSRAWRGAHSMAALGGGYAWPGLEVSGDGEFVQFSLRREPSADAAAIRYLNEIVSAEVAAADFESAVDRFCDEVEARIAASPGLENTLRELRQELRSERADAALAQRCRREARAGYDAGDAPPSFHPEVDRLSQEMGEVAVEDALAATSDCRVLRAALDAVKRARTEVDLSAAARAWNDDPRTKPWQRGVDAAREARRALSVGSGPVSDDDLRRILGIKVLPVEPDAAPDTISGGFRSSDRLASTRVVVRSRRVESQRFYFCRLLGMAALIPSTNSFLPIATTHTAFQKAARSFAQEFLVPWAELDEWTDQHGTGEESIALAAERYRVSELLITATLVNRGKLDRERLARFAD